MAFTTIGYKALADAVMGGTTYTKFNAAHTYLGVGSATTVFNAADTDLKATTYKIRKEMEPAYPQRTDNTITFKTHFNANEAIWSWEEYGIFNKSVGACTTAPDCMLTRKVVPIIEKTGAMDVYLTVTLTIGST